MPTTFKWLAPEAIVTYYTTELNSLADAAFAGAGAAVTNETGATGLYQYLWLELVLAALSPAAGAFVDVWALAALDAVPNYSDAAKPLQTSKLLYTFQLDTTAATAQRIVTPRPVLCPALDFKMDLRNKAGVAFGATLNTFKYRRSYDQGV